MSDSLELTCRCGWRSEFGASQIGMDISCPSCGRDFFITEDPAEFLNRNVGSEDFAFADGEDEDEPIVPVPAPGTPASAPSAPVRGARPPRPIAPRRGPRHGGTERVGEEHTGRFRAGSRTPVRRSKSWAPVIVGVGLLAAAVGIFALLSRENHEKAYRAARHALREVVDDIAARRFTETARQFTERRDADTLQTELKKLARDGTRDWKLDELSEKTSGGGLFREPNAYSASYEFLAGEKPYLCHFDLVRQNDRWKVSSCRVERDRFRGRRP